MTQRLLSNLMGQMPLNDKSVESLSKVKHSLRHHLIYRYSFYDCDQGTPSCPTLKQDTRKPQGVIQSGAFHMDVSAWTPGVLIESSHEPNASKDYEV